MSAASKEGALRLSDHPLVVAGSVLAGFAVGRVAPGMAEGLEFIHHLYVDLLQMVVLPFMLAAMVFSLRKLLAQQGHGRLVPRVVLASAGLLGFTALASLLAGLVVGPGRHLSADELLAMGRMAGTGPLGSVHDSLALFARDHAEPVPRLGALVQALIPVNIFASLSTGETLKVTAFALMFGVAVGRVRGQVAESLTEVLETVYRACMTLTGWFNHLLPLVLLATVANQTARTGLGPLETMFRFLLALGLATILLVTLFLWLMRFSSRRPWRSVLRSQREPLLMGLITDSTQACMPKMIDSLASGLGVPRERAELLVPTGISLVRAGSVLHVVMATVFVAQLYGAHLGPPQLATIVGISMMASLASAGMSAGMAAALAAIACKALSLPFEAALVLISAVEPVSKLGLILAEVAGNNAFAALAAGHAPAGKGGAPGHPPP